MLSHILRLTVLVLCLSACRSPWYPRPAEQIFECHIKRMCYKYDLELVHLEYWRDHGSRNPRHMDGLTVVYYGIHMTDVEGAREMIVDCVNTFICAAKKSPDVRSNLLVPLTLDNIEMRIDYDHFLGDYLSTVSYVGEEPEYSFIGHVLVRNGQIYYYTFRDELVVKEPFDCAEDIICIAHMEECYKAECKGAELRAEVTLDFCELEEDSLNLPMARFPLQAEEEEQKDFVIEKQWQGADDDAEFDPERGFHRFDEENFMRQEDVRY